MSSLPYLIEHTMSSQLKKTKKKKNNISRQPYNKSTHLHCTTLRSLLSKPKDPIPTEDRNNVIYQLDCNSCEAVYVGEPKRTLNIRTNEHISAAKSASKRSHTFIHSHLPDDGRSIFRNVTKKQHDSRYDKLR